MKKTIQILFVFVLLSCDSSDTIVTNSIQQDTIRTFYDHELRHPTPEDEIKCYEDLFPQWRYQKYKFKKFVNINSIDTFGLDTSLNYSLSYYLYGFYEDPLAEYIGEKKVFRLTFISTFSHPFVIRLEKDTIVNFIYKKTSGVSGYYVGDVDTYLKKTVSDSVWIKFNHLVDQAHLLDPQIINLEEKGKDGTNMILEYRDSLDYHIYYSFRIRNFFDDKDSWFNFLIKHIDTKVDFSIVDE